MRTLGRGLGLGPKWIATRRGDMLVYDSETAGSPPLLLLHGLGRGAAQLLPLALAFRRVRRVILPDLLDFAGPSRSHTGTTSLPHHVDTLHELLDALDVAAVDVAGVSFGGWLAVLHAASDPARVRRLFLVNPAGLREGSAEIGELYRTADTDDTLYHRVISGAPFVGVPLVSALLARGFSRTLTHPSIVRFLQTVRPEHFVDDVLCDLECATYLLLGRDDRLLPATATRDRYLASVRDVDGAWAEGCSHNLGYEAFETMCAELARFIGIGRLPRSRVLDVAAHLRVPPRLTSLREGMPPAGTARASAS
jgi:pimeloyl-ACP methyl ester carboxylesterase